MQTHTAKMLRSYSVKAEVEKIYYDILSAAKNGEHSCMFILPKEKEVFILLEIARLFPDTKFTEVNSIYRTNTVLSASWSVLNSLQVPSLS
jgi:hypothetical protein